jgi:tetratricopeptide (TPR) repeat protein
MQANVASGQKESRGANQEIGVMGAMGGGSTGQQRLDSWKEIGAFFGRDERTAKRWERERGLPVHRVPGSGRGRVYAYPVELTEWLESAGVAADEIEPATDLGRDAGLDVTSDSGEILVAEPGMAGVLPGQADAAAAHIQLQAEIAERFKPVVSDYEQAGFARSGESPVRMPEPMPRLSLVQPMQPKLRVDAEAPRVAAAPEVASERTLPTGRVEVETAPKIAAKNWTKSLWIGAACVLVIAVAGTAWKFDRARMEQSATAAESRAANAEAENLYLQGKYYWQQRTPEGLTKAVDLFTQAIVHDPQYAPAYAGLAECYDLLREYTSMPDKEAFPRAIAAAERAIQLNPNLAQAHAALAFALFYWSWDTQRAMQEFQQALELDPNSATTHHWYANALMSVGKPKEAMAQIEQAQKLDPGSRAILADKGCMMANSGQVEEAKELLQQVEQADPEFISPHEYLSRIALAQGDGVTYVRELRKTAAMRNDPERARLADAMEKAYAAGGADGLKKAWEADVREQYAAGKTGPYIVAVLESRKGHREAAMKLLEQAYAKRDPNLRDLVLGPDWNGYRDDPRFQALMREMGVA